MKSKHKRIKAAAIALFTLTCTSMSHGATILFQDGFEADTAGSGNTLVNWTQSDDTRVYAVNSQAHTGSNSVFMRNSGARIMGLKSAIDITGTTALEISWWMRQGSTYESGDTFSFEIDFGSGFQSVVAEAGLADGGTYSYAGTANTLPTDAGQQGSFTQYTVNIDSSYYIGTLGSSDIELRFLHNTGSNSEDGYFDDITVTAVPEPATLSLLFIGLGGFLLTRRKRK